MSTNELYSSPVDVETTWDVPMAGDAQFTWDVTQATVPVKVAR